MPDQTNRTYHFASELRYLGKGTIERTEADGNLIVSIIGVGRGRVAPDMAFKTKREALGFSTVRLSAGWSDVAKLGTMI